MEFDSQSAWRREVVCRKSEREREVLSAGKRFRKVQHDIQTPKRYTRWSTSAKSAEYDGRGVLTTANRYVQ